MSLAGLANTIRPIIHVQCMFHLAGFMVAVVFLFHCMLSIIDVCSLSFSSCLFSSRMERVGSFFERDRG